MEPPSTSICNAPEKREVLLQLWGGHVMTNEEKIQNRNEVQTEERHTPAGRLFEVSRG